MKNLVPRSLAGQMAILIGVALLVAQLANMLLLLDSREKLALAQAEGPAITRFVQSLGDYQAAKPEDREEILRWRSGRGARIEIEAETSITQETRRPNLEARLLKSLIEAGISSKTVRASRREDNGPPRPDWGRQDGPRGEQAATAANRQGWSAPAQREQGPQAQDRNQDRPWERFGDRSPWERFEQRRDFRQLQLAVQLPDGQWFEGRLSTPALSPLLPFRLIGATVFLYLIVLGVTVAIAAWLARPLRELTASAQAFGGRAPQEEVKERGPGDVRRLIVAFNAMNKRVLALMVEKDRMLGAIGHDLRTPLASLRIRAENMDPPEERERLVATIEEATAMLEDILVLARTGQSGEAGREMDLAALLDAVAEEYHDLGRPVTMTPATRTVAKVQPNLLRRAIRNLVDNAVTYGGSATLELSRNGKEVAISISDNGPGIPADALERVLEPFERGEASRNRATGGAGLGLAIASAIVQGHCGRLTLENRAEGGLRATLHLPV